MQTASFWSDGDRNLSDLNQDPFTFVKQLWNLAIDFLTITTKALRNWIFARPSAAALGSKWPCIELAKLYGVINRLNPILRPDDTTGSSTWRLRIVNSRVNLRWSSNTVNWDSRLPHLQYLPNRIRKAKWIDAVKHRSHVETQLPFGFSPNINHPPQLVPNTHSKCIKHWDDTGDGGKERISGSPSSKYDIVTREIGQVDARSQVYANAYCVWVKALVGRFWHNQPEKPQ